jgi:formylglycine-generating enzyme required for sulfatase activity
VHFCALELVEGEDLAKRITRLGRLTEDEALSITNQIAMALQHAFYNGLVHRDVKPENIMVTADGTAKLLDLGLARPANQEATRLTESGMFVGSPYYASPEQALGEREIDTRADIYSLGATLYHMVTGKPPFEGTTALAILQKHVNEKLPWPAEVNPELSDGLCRVVAKMMEKSREDRYQTPNDLNCDLDLLQGGGEPEVDVAALKNSSVKVPAVRPRGRRRPDSRARMTPVRERAAARRPERRRRDSARERRRGAEGGPRPGEKPSRWAALPTGAKIAMGAGALGLMVVIGLAMFLGGGEPDRKPPKPGRREAAARRSPAAKAKPLPKAEPPPTLTLDLGGGVKMEFVYIRPGTFMMGGNEDLKHSLQGVEKPKHEVAITRGFYIGKYQVTQSEHEAIMGGNPSKWKGPNRPVQRVTWDEAAEFCRLAAERTKRQFRLPTEAEWEYACRAGTTTRFSFGDSEGGLGEYAWYKHNSGGQTHPVGQKKPNAWGLYDTHGNVWEWVADWYDAGYYAKSPREDPAGPQTGVHRLLRGGGRGVSSDVCRSAFRRHLSPPHRGNDIGFRACVSASPRVSASAHAAYRKAIARAKIRVRLKNWKGAAEACEEALKLKPGDAEAKKLLAEAESHLPPPKTLTLDLGRGVKMEFVYIKPGVFVMGGTENPKAGWQGVEKPKHEVAITRGFYIGKYEVTQAQYEAVTGKTPSKSREPNHPVEQVSWYDAVEFCRLATERTRKRFRLPTEAEWEYACRAGSTGRYSFGSDEADLREHAWYGRNSGRRTHPVGQKKPNQWGLYDVHGNLWEWVADRYAADYYAKSPRENPTGPDAGDRRILRGGSCEGGGAESRSAIRAHLAPSHRGDHGLRAVVSLTPRATLTASRQAAHDRAMSRAVAPLPEGKLVPNGDFEKPGTAPEIAEGWMKNQWGSAQGAFSVRLDRVNPHGGERSLVVRTLTEGVHPGARTTLTSALVPGRYELRFWACAAVGKSADVCAHFAGRDVISATVGEDWKQFKTTVEIKQKKARASLRLYTTTSKVRGRHRPHPRPRRPLDVRRGHGHDRARFVRQGQRRHRQGRREVGEGQDRRRA